MGGTGENQMRLLPRFIPSFRIVRKVWNEEGLLRIELSKYWEIIVSRRWAEDKYRERVVVGKYGAAIFKDKGFIKLIKAGHIIPTWYGFAYHDFDTDSAAYMPIPINFIYASFRWFKYRILYKVRLEWPHWMMLWERRIYRLGQIDGYEAGKFTRSLSISDDTIAALAKLTCNDFGCVYGVTDDDCRGKNGCLREAIQLVYERAKNRGVVPEMTTDLHRMLEGVDPQTNPGFSKLYKAGE